MASLLETSEHSVAERALDTARALVIVVDRRGRVLIINRFARELLGWSAEELRGRDAVELLVPDEQRPRAREALVRSLAGQPLDGVTRPVLLRDGGIRLVRWSAAETVGPGNGIDALVYVGHDVTDRERMRALLEFGEKLARMGSWECDADGRFRVSRGLRRMLGIADGDARGAAAFRARVHPDDRARLEALLATPVAQLGDAPLELDFRMQYPDGEIRHAHAESHCDPVLGVRRGILLDVTEVQRAHEELQGSEQRLRALFNQRIELAAFVALDGTLLEPNARALTHAGVKREDVVGRPLWDAPWWSHDAAARAQVREAVARAAAGEFVRFDTAQRRADGTLAAIDFSLAPVLGDDGRPQYLFAEGVDISAQVEAQRALAHSRLRNAELLELLDDAPDGYYVIDARSHRFLWVSGGARRNLGYGAEELAGMTCADLSPELDAPRLCQLLAPLERGEVDEIKLETEHVRKDGSRYPIDVRYARGHYRGEPALFAVVAETSERRRLEAQLLQAQKLEALGTLAGGVAHDFNNLLTSMRGSAELLLRQAEAGGPVERAARRVLMAADRGQQLTAQLLAYSRPAAQRSEPIDLSGAVREVYELLARTVGEDIRFELSLAPEPWPVVADPGQINQVLVNLIVNARDSMVGGGTLSIATANARLDGLAASGLDLDPGDYVRVTVLDTGKGMSPEVQARIFDPFFTTKGPGKGTGLGLATVLAIVQRHGGRIRVESQEGRGTRFDIWLPRAPEGSTVARMPGSVLVVVRDPILRDLVSELLEERGYRVHASASPEQAARAAQGDAPELVIADASFASEPLPEAIRGRATRALYLAGDDGRTLAPAEDASVLAKPFSNEALLAKVRELLGR